MEKVEQFLIGDKVLFFEGSKISYEIIGYYNGNVVVRNNQNFDCSVLSRNELDLISANTWLVL